MKILERNYDRSISSKWVATREHKQEIWREALLPVWWRQAIFMGSLFPMFALVIWVHQTISRSPFAAMAVVLIYSSVWAVLTDTLREQINDIIWARKVIYDEGVYTGGET